MSDTLEERVRRLEAFRYRALGLLNAQNTILSDRWCNVIANADPQNVLATLDRLRDQWLGDADKPHIYPASIRCISTWFPRNIGTHSNCLLW